MRSPRSSCSGPYDWPAQRAQSKVSISIEDTDAETEIMEQEIYLGPPKRHPRMARRTSSLVLPPTQFIMGSPEHFRDYQRSTSLKKFKHTSYDRDIDQFHYNQPTGMSLKRRNPLLAKVETKGTSKNVNIFKKIFNKTVDEEDGDCETDVRLNK